MKQIKYPSSGIKAQTITLDLIIGVSIFLTTIVLFYYLFGIDVTKTEEEDVAQEIIDGLSGTEYFDDSYLDSDEIEELSAMNCSELGVLFDTNKNICIYATDSDGNLIELDNKNGLGCGGIEVEDVICGREG